MTAVLDHGYVRYVKHMGDDLDVVNSARVSFDKQSDTMEARDERLLRFLFDRTELSVLRHSAITFECYAPMMVKNQWQKYQVASAHLEDQNGWNESSRRYVTETPTFYTPQADQWRWAPTDRKQGSGGLIDPGAGIHLTHTLNGHYERSLALYNGAIANGVAPELARLFLPAYALYVRWRWTASLATVLHFLRERLKADAQDEIHAYADAVMEIVEEHFPVVVREFKKVADL